MGKLFTGQGWIGFVDWDGKSTHASSYVLTQRLMELVMCVIAAA